jgi:hypothetical protein
VGLQAVHRYDLPLAHQNGGRLCPLGRHLGLPMASAGRQHTRTRVLLCPGELAGNLQPMPAASCVGNGGTSTHGGSGTCSSCPGRMRGAPVTSSADETAESSLGAACNPNSTQEFHRGPAPSARKASLIFPMHALDHPIALRVVGSGEQVLNERGNRQDRAVRLNKADHHFGRARPASHLPVLSRKEWPDG